MVVVYHLRKFKHNISTPVECKFQIHHFCQEIKKISFALLQFPS